MGNSVGGVFVVATLVCTGSRVCVVSKPTNPPSSFVSDPVLCFHCQTDVTIMS